MEKSSGKIKNERQKVTDRWDELGLLDNDSKSISMKKAAKTIGLDLVRVKPSECRIDDINGWITGHPMWDPWWETHGEPKGQIISDLDPYGEENWDDEIPESPLRYCEENLLPISMKIAAQTIGLDLVAVKPISSPRIDMLFVDFKYGSLDNEPKGQIFSDIDPYGEEIWD